MATGWKEKAGTSDCVRITARGTIHDDDVGLASRATANLAKMIAANVNVFEAAGLTVSEKKMEPMLLRASNPASSTSPLVIEAQQGIMLTDNPVFVPGTFFQRHRRQYARY